MPDEIREETRRRVPSIVVKIGIAIILLAVGATIAVSVIRQKPEVLGLSKGQAQIQAEVDRLVSEVGKLISLPSDETPTIATVTDVEKVKDQPFFKNSQNGDKVLIYTDAKKAFLYRPSEKRMIEVGVVNIRQNENQGETTPEATATPESTETPLP